VVPGSPSKLRRNSSGRAVFDDLGLKWPGNLVCSAPKNTSQGTSEAYLCCRIQGLFLSPNLFRMTGG
jgi:hypothetical protein